MKNTNYHEALRLLQEVAESRIFFSESHDRDTGLETEISDFLLKIEKSVSQQLRMVKQMVELKDWQTRVVIERNELQEKIEKLKDFIYNADFNFDDTQFNLLKIQLASMKAYCEILDVRISYF